MEVPVRANFIGILILMSASLACGKREEIPLTPWNDDRFETPQNETAADATRETEPVAPAETAQDLPEAGQLPPVDPVPMAATKDEPAKKPDFMRLKFAHTDNLCLEADADARTSLQTCSEDSDGAKFQAVTALDGRVQYQNIKSKLCLASGGDRFTGFVIQMEACTAKPSQFFTKVLFENLFALRQDGEGRCLYAENGAKVPGARVVMFPCANDMAQRLVL
jgi:hypothetical protein